MKKGFTLIEIMVSLSIFLIVMTISMGAILGVFSANNKSQNLKAAMDNLNAALETMSREARFGTVYHCGSGSVSTAQDCQGGGSLLAFKDQDGEQIVYTLSGTSLTKSVNGSTPIAVTSKEVNINSLTFYVLGTSDATTQPKIFMRIKGTAGTDAKSSSSFAIQTLISQRVLGSPASGLSIASVCSDSGLLGCWEFDEGSGSTAADSSGIGAAGTLQGAVSWVPGYVGTALSFPGGAGSGDELDIPGGSLGATSVTVSADVIFNSAAEATMSASYDNLGAVVFSTRNFDSDVSPTLLITPQDGGSGNSSLGAAFVCDSSALAVGAKATVPISASPSTWHHIAGVFSRTGSGHFAGTWTVYIDGNQASNNFDLTPSKDCSSFIGSPWIVGNNPTWPGESNITVDNLRVYNRALSAAEIAALP